MRRTNFFCPRCFVFRIYPLYLFPKIWFRRPLSEARMKREPGAIPGQSRCCEAPQHSEHLSHWPRAGKASEQEPVRRPAKSIRHRTRPWDGRSISEVFHQDEELTRRCAPFRPADAVAGIRLPRCRTRPRLPAAGEKGQQRAGQEVRQEGRTGGRTGIISGRPRTADKGASHEKGCTAGKRPATGAHHRRRGTVQAPVPTGTRPLKRHELLARHEFRHGTSPRSGTGPASAQAPGAAKAQCSGYPPSRQELLARHKLPERYELPAPGKPPHARQAPHRETGRNVLIRHTHKKARHPATSLSAIITGHQVQAKERD